MATLLVPKALSQFNKTLDGTSTSRRATSPIRSKSISSYLDTNTRYLKVAPASLPKKMDIDSFIDQEKTRNNNARELDAMAEMINLAPNTTMDPKEVGANFVLEQILEQNLEVCSGKGYVKPGVTAHADQWHEVDIVGVSNDAFRVLFPQLEMFRQAKIHSIIIEGLQVKRAPFALETGVEDIAESSEPCPERLTDDDLLELFKLSFRSDDKNLFKSTTGVCHIRSDRDLLEFLESRRRDRKAMLANSRALVESQQLPEYTYPSTLDLSATDDAADIHLKDLEPTALGSTIANPEETSELSVFTITSKYGDGQQPLRPHEFQFQNFFEEEIPKVPLSAGEPYGYKNNLRANLDTSETDLPLDITQDRHYGVNRGYQASVLLSSAVHHNGTIDNTVPVAGNQQNSPPPIEDSSKIVSHSFDILSTLDILERRDKEIATKRAPKSTTPTAPPPNSLPEQHTGSADTTHEHTHESSERVAFQYIDRNNQVVVRDFNKQFLQKFSRIHIYQRMKESFEAALRRLNQLVEEKSVANRPYLDFLSTAYIGYTLFYNLKTRLSEDYCIDCVAEIKERRLRLKNRERDYNLFMSVLKAIKDRSERIHDIRSRSVCGFTSVITAPHLSILPSIYKEDRKVDKQNNKKTTNCTALTEENEETEEYILALMRLKQNRERVYEHFERMIVGHNQVRSSAVELCLSAINTHRAKLEGLVNPTLKRTAQFDGFEALNNLYKSYVDHALKTDFATEIIEQADRDPTHELYWCARQLLRLRNASYKNYRKYKYPCFCPRRREAFENARAALMENKIFLGTSEYRHVFNDLMSTVQEHLQYLILTPELLERLQDTFIPKISDYLFANMVFQTDIDKSDKDIKSIASRPSTGMMNLQTALQTLPGAVTPERLSYASGSSVRVGNCHQNKEQEVAENRNSNDPTTNQILNPVLKRPINQDLTTGTNMPILSASYKPKNAYEWIQRRYWQIQSNREKDIIRRKEDLIRRDVEEATKSASALMTKDFSYKPRGRTQAEEIYEKIFKFPAVGETNFMEKLSIYLANCFILLYEVLFPFIQESLMLNFSDLAFEQTNKKVKAYCNLTGISREALAADIAFDFQCQALEENRLLFRKIQKKVEILLFKILHTYVMEDIYPQWSVFILLLFHGADRDIRYIAKSKALSSFSYILNTSRFNDEYMDILKRAHDLNITMGYTKLYSDVEQIDGLSMSSLGGFVAPAFENDFTKNSPLATRLNKTLADAMIRNISLIGDTNKKSDKAPQATALATTEAKVNASTATQQAHSTDNAQNGNEGCADSAHLFTSRDVLAISVQRIQNITEMHDFIYSQPTIWYFTNRIIIDIKYLNKEEEVQFSLTEPRMRKIISLFNNTECILSAVKNQRGLVTNLLFTPSPSDIFSSLPMFVYDLVDFYSSCPIFADNLFPEPVVPDKDINTRPFGARYNIPTTTDSMNNFTFEAIARLGNDEPLQKVIHEVITTDDNLPVRSGSDLIMTLGSNSSLPAGIMHRPMKKTNAKKDALLRSILRSTSHRAVSRGAARMGGRSINFGCSSQESPGESRRRARSKLTQYRFKNASPPTVPIRTSQVVPEGDVPFMDMSGKADLATVANITFNIKTRNTTYSQQVASFFDSHGKIGTYMEARKCNRLHYEPPTILYRLANLTKHAALNLKNYLDMVLIFLMRYAKESLKFAEKLLNAQDIIPRFIIERNWQVESLLNRTQARIKEYYKAARMSLHATFKDRHHEEKAKVSTACHTQREKSAIECSYDHESSPAPSKKQSLSDGATDQNSIFTAGLLDKELPFVYEAELLSQFLRSDALIAAITADYIPGSAPPEVLLSQVISVKNRASYVSRALLSMYHLYDGFWCLTVMPTECFFGTLRLDLKQVIIRLRHIYENIFLLAASRIDDYVYLASQVAQKCIQSMQLSFSAAKFSTPDEIGVSFSLFRTFMHNTPVWGEYFNTMQSIENHLSEVAYGTKLSVVYANLLRYRIQASRMLFSNQGFLPKIGSSLHTVHHTARGVINQIEGWVFSASEAIFPRIIEMLSLTAYDKLNCDRNISDFRRRFANSICSNLSLPFGIDSTQTCIGSSFQQLLYANIWAQSGLPFLSKKSIQDSRLILQQNRVDCRSINSFQFFERPQTIHPIHISTVFLEMEDLIKRLIDLLHITNRSNCEILGFHNSQTYKNLSPTELFARLEKDGEFEHIDKIDYVLFGDSKDVTDMGAKMGSKMDETKLAEMKKKKLIYYSKLLKHGEPLPIRPENIRLIISESPYSSDATTETRLMSLLPLVSLTCKLILLSDDLNTQIEDWFSRPINTISIQDIKSSIIHAIYVALSFLASVGDEIAISSIARMIFEKLSNYRQQFIVLFVIKAALDNMQIGFGYDVTAYDTFQPYNNGDIAFDDYLGIDSREPLSISLYVKDMLSKAQCQLTDDVIARKAVDIFMEYADKLHFAMNTYCVKMRIDKLIQLQHHEISMSVLGSYESILLESFLLPVFCDPRSDFSLTAEPDFLCTEFSRVSDASSCLLPSMRPVVYTSKIKGRSGTGKFLTTTNCAGFYSYKPIVAKSLAHDLHLPPLRILKMSSAIRSLRKLRYLMVGGSERTFMQSLNHYQADLFTSYTSYHTDGLFDVEWLSSSSIISYRSTTTGTLFNKPISCYNICKSEMDEYIASVARPPIEACLHNALEQTTDTAAQIEWASVLEALGFVLADLRAMDHDARVEHILQNRLEAYWNTLVDAFVCSSFYRDAYENSSAAKHVFLTPAPSVCDELYTTENTIYLHARNIKDLLRVRKLHQGARIRPQQPAVPRAKGISPLISGYVFPHINTFITRLRHFQFTIMRGLYEQQLWLEPIMTHLYNVSVVLQLVMLQWRAFRELSALNICLSLNHSASAAFDPKTSLAIKVSPEKLKENASNIFCYKPFIEFSPPAESFGQMMSDLIMALKYASASRFNAGLSFSQLTLRKTSHQGLWTLCSDILNAQATAIQTCAHVCGSQLLDPLRTHTSGHRLLFSAIVEVALYESYYSPTCRPKSAPKVPEFNSKHHDPLPFVAIPLPQRIVDAISTVLACCGHVGYEFVVFKLLYPTGAYIYYIDGILQRSRYAHRWTKTHSAPQSSTDQLIFTKEDVSYSLLIDPAQRVSAATEAVEYLPLATPLCFQYLHLLFTTTTIAFINHCISLSFSRYTTQFSNLLQTELLCSGGENLYRNELSYFIRGLPLRVTIHAIRKLMLGIQEGAIYQHSESLESLEKLNNLVASLRQIVNDHRKYKILTFDKSYTDLILERAMHRLSRLHDLHTDALTIYIGDPSEIGELHISRVSDPSYHPAMNAADVDSLCALSSSDEEDDVLDQGVGAEQALANLRNKLDHRLEQTAHSQLRYDPELCKIDRRLSGDTDQTYATLTTPENGDTISRVMTVDRFLSIGQTTSLVGFSDSMLEAAILLPHFTDSRSQHILDTLDEMDSLVSLIRGQLTRDPDTGSLRIETNSHVSSSFLGTYSCFIACPTKEIEKYEVSLGQCLKKASMQFFSKVEQSIYTFCQTEIESISSFHNEVYSEGGLIGRLGATPLEIDAPYFVPSFRGLQSFIKATELLLTEHFVVLITPAITGYSDPRVLNFLNVKLPLHMAYSVVFVSAASKLFSALEILRLLATPMLVIVRDVTSEPIKDNTTSSLRELSSLFAAVSTTKTPGRLVIWDPSLIAAASDPAVYELSPLLRSALSAAQIPLSSHYIVMTSDLYEYDISSHAISLPKSVICLTKMLSGYISMPKVSLNTIKSFIAQSHSGVSATDDELRNSYRMVLSILSLQCCSNHKLMIFMEIASSVIGKTGLGVDLTGKNALGALKTFLGIEFWGTRVLTKVAPRLPAFVYLMTPNLRNRTVHKLTGVSVIGPVADSKIDKDLDLTDPHSNCSTHILSEVLSSICLPCIRCPSWIEMFYEQFYAVDCRALVPLNTKGWGVLASLAYSILNRTDNLIHGLYLGITDFKIDFINSSCLSVIERLSVQSALTHGFDLMTDTYTTELLVLSLMRILTDFQLSSNAFSLKTLLNDTASSIPTSLNTKKEIFKIYNELDTVPVISAIRVIRSLNDLHTSYNGDVILDSHCIYILVIPEQHISVSSDRYQHIVKILSARKESTTKLIVLTNCRAIYNFYVELGITTESPLAQELDGSCLCGMLSHAHLLYEFASSLSYDNIVESHNNSTSAFAELDAVNISATMFEETLSSFVFTIEQRISAINLAECLKILLVPILYIPIDIYKLGPTLSTQTLLGITTIYLYLLQLYSIIIAKPKLATFRACIYPHYKFECSIDFLMIITLVTDRFPTALAYLIAMLFSLAVTAVKLFLLCSTDHVFNRDLLLSKLNDDPVAVLTKYHNKCLCDMLQLILLEKKTKSQYECAMNKISSEFNQPIFECTQILNLYFKNIIDLLNSPGDSQVHRTPYFYLLPQFPDLCATKEIECDSYESILAVRTIISSYKHCKRETLGLLRRVIFEMSPLSYPGDFLADATDIHIPEREHKVDLSLYRAAICRHKGLSRWDHKGLSLAYCLAASAYFCKPLCIASSFFGVQNTIVLRHAYPLIKQDCSLMVHSEYVSPASITPGPTTDMISTRSYFRVTKLYLRDESDIRVFLYRHQSWFCLTENCNERLAIAFVRTIIIIEVECPEVLASGFLSSFAYHQLIQMPDPLGHVMTYKMVNVCPIINVCLTVGQKKAGVDTLNLLSHLYCPYVITDCYAAPEAINETTAPFTPTHHILLYVLRMEMGSLLDTVAVAHLCKRIVSVPLSYSSLLPILQAFSQIFSMYLYSKAPSSQVLRSDSSPDTTTDTINAVDNILDFIYFQQFGIQIASNSNGSNPQHLIESIVSNLIPTLSSVSLESSSILAGSLSSEPSIYPVFSKNYLLHILSIHINMVHMQSLSNRIIFHYSGSLDRYEKLLMRMRQAASSASSDNLFLHSARNNPIPSFSLDSIDTSLGSPLIVLDKLLRDIFHRRLPPAKLERLLTMPYASGIRTPISVVISSYLSYDEFVFSLSRLTCSEVKVPISSKRSSVSSVVVDLGGICGTYPSVDIGTDQTLGQLSTRERILMSIRAAVGSILRLSPSSYMPTNARKDRTDTYLLRTSVSYYDEQAESCVATDSIAGGPVRYLFGTSATADEYSVSISEHSMAFPSGRFMGVPSPSSIICSNIQDVHASLYTFAAYTGLQPTMLPEYNRVIIVAPISLLLGTSTLGILLSFGEMSSSDSLWRPSELSDVLSDFTTNASVSTPTVSLLNGIIATRLNIFIFDDLNIMDSRATPSPDLQRLRTFATMLNLQDYSHILPTNRHTTTESFNLDYFYAEEAFGERIGDSDSSEAASPMIGNDIQLLANVSKTKPVTLLPSDLLAFTEATTNSTNPYIIMMRLRCSHLLKYMWRLFSPGYTLPQNILVAVFGSANNGYALSNKSIPSTAMSVKSQLESMQKSRVTLTGNSSRMQSGMSSLSSVKDMSNGELDPVQIDTELQHLSKRILMYCNLIYRTLGTGAIRENPVTMPKQATLLSDKFVHETKEHVPLATDPGSIMESSCPHSESQIDTPRRPSLDKRPSFDTSNDTTASDLIKDILESLPQAVTEFTVLRHYVSIELMTSLASVVSNSILVYYSKEQLSIQDSAITLANLQHHINNIQRNAAIHNKRIEELDKSILAQEETMADLMKQEVEFQTTANSMLSEKDALALVLDNQLEDIFLKMEPCRMKVEESISFLYRLFRVSSENSPDLLLSDTSVELLKVWFNLPNSSLQASTLSLDTALSIKLSEIDINSITGVSLSPAALAFLEEKPPRESTLCDCLHRLGNALIEYKSSSSLHAAVMADSNYASYHKLSTSLALTKVDEELVKARIHAVAGNLEGSRREKSHLESQRKLFPGVDDMHMPIDDISMLIAKRTSDELRCRRMLYLAALYGSLISACILFGFHHLGLFTAMLSASFSKNADTPLCSGCQIVDHGSVCHACHNCRCFCRCTRTYQPSGAYTTNVMQVIPLLCADIVKKEQLMHIITQIFGDVYLTKSSLQYRLTLGHTALLEYISCIALCQIPSRAPVYVSGNVVHSMIAEAVSGSPGHSIIFMKNGHKLIDDTDEFYDSFVSTLQETLSAHTHSVIFFKIETINWKALDLLGALTYDLKLVAGYGSISNVVDHNFSKYKFASSPSSYQFFVTWGPEIAEVFRSVSTRLSLPNLFLFSQSSFAGSNLQNLSTCILDSKTAARTHSLASSMTMHRENLSTSIISFLNRSYFADLIELRLEQESLIKQTKLGMKQFTTMHLNSDENAVLTMLSTIHQQVTTQAQYILSIDSLEKKLLNLIKQRDSWTRGSDSVVSTATQTLLAFSNYLARLSTRYPALSVFWTMLNPANLQKIVESVDNSVYDAMAGSFYRLMLHVLLPHLTRALPAQQYYLTVLTLIVIGELSARTALPSTITAWEAILKATEAELDEVVTRELNALLSQAKTHSLHSSIVTCLSILSEGNSVSTQLIDNLSPIIFAIHPQCTPPQSDCDFISPDQPHFIKGGGPILLFAEDPIVTCNLLAGELLRAGRSVNISAPSPVHIHSSLKSNDMSWIRTLMMLEDPFYSDELPRVTAFKVNNSTSQASPLSAVTLIVCQSIGSVELVLQSIQGVPGRIVIVLWTGHVEESVLKASVMLIKLIAAHPTVTCVHSRGYMRRATKDVVYMPPVVSLTRSRLYGQQVMQGPYKHQPLAWFNLALDLIIPLLSPELTFPIAPYIYTRLERLSLFKTVLTEDYCPPNTVIENMLFLGDGVASKFSPATIIQYRHDELSALLDGSLFQRIANYILAPLCLTDHARHLVTLYTFCLWLFIKHLKKDDAGTLATKIAPFSLTKICGAQLSGTMQPKDQILAIIQSFGVLLTSKPIEWAKYNDQLAWYHANTIPSHALLMGRVIELPKISLWRPKAQTPVLSYPVTYKLTPSSEGKEKELCCYAAPLSQSNQTTSAPNNNSPCPEETTDTEDHTNDIHHSLLLHLVPTGALSLLRS